LCRASENTPFFDLCLFGTNSNLRGYTVGRYQDRSLFAVQTELRAQLRPRWGAVVFAGVGEVAPDFGEMNADDLLPAAGVGLRWMAAPENKVNISADLAWGKGEDMTFYLSIGEAF
jgi:outer membrane translocation and assembly module TamA